MIVLIPLMIPIPRALPISSISFSFIPISELTIPAPGPKMEESCGTVSYAGWWMKPS